MMAALVVPGLLVTTLCLLITIQNFQTFVQAAPEDSASIEARLRNEKDLTPDQTSDLLEQLEESESMDVSKLLEQNLINQENCTPARLLERYIYRMEVAYDLVDMEAVVKFVDDRYNKQLDFCLETWKNKPDSKLLRSLSKSDRLDWEQFYGWVKFYENQKVMELGPLDGGDIVFIAEGKLSESLAEKDQSSSEDQSSKAEVRRSITENLAKSCRAALRDLEQLIEFLRAFEAGKRSLGLDGNRIGARLIMLRDTYGYCAKLTGRQDDDDDYNRDFEVLPLSYNAIELDVEE